MKKMIFNFIYILLSFGVLAAFTTGCYRTTAIEGNYDLITETRAISGFDEVSLEGFMDVEYVQSDYFEVQVEAESNLIPYIETSVRNNTLRIKTYDNRNLRNNYAILIRVFSPDLAAYSLSGSGDFDCENLVNDAFELLISGSGDVNLGIDTYDLKIKISGSGNAELWGIAEDTELIISGSGNIHAYDLETKNSRTRISGSGNMYLQVTDYLKVNITGSGDIYYFGQPAIDANITGTGSIIHVEGK
ncbi:MAG: DUF2807 domain-containing protein [Bacteroidales bacterium]|nr:DUF2807 domain-containing protein [Bacteroidales bacterium]